MIPPRAPLPSVDPADYAARLAIVVPYRDREEHLAQFVPHLVTYFERDRFAKAIPYEIHIAEQAPGKPFNRGAMKNAGFSLAHRNADYVVFHDVDYLPIWADYSRVRQPTSLIAYGVEGAPHAYSNTPGCVIAMPVTIRASRLQQRLLGLVEDVDLKQRFFATACASMTRRLFNALPHPHHGGGRRRRQRTI